ncbi:hypothetical protein DEAC_c06780 [Desulfosporosinus acididurans]|uniref:Uncharacterized protein n=1 Tax=Desulfosporosinus acididurans TaxID=476652 RepID=A0A0J1IS25_9FIRM|nr:hypothetical protein [Desulfosporosinus acididurans]KLU67466.1 hypothetical protein DEAC_c06780 [Desulfosporosinus acididurans]
MNQNENKVSQQTTNNHVSMQNTKNSPSNANEKERDNLNPAKDKSPDDLEIF